MNATTTKTGSAAAVVAVAGLVLLLLKRSKAKASTSTQALPSSARTPPQLPADTRRSTAQEGQPLAWDRTEHPLADRGLDDADAAALQVIPVAVDASPQPAAAPSTAPAAPAQRPAPAAPPAPPAAAVKPAASKRKPTHAAAPAQRPAPAAPPAASVQRAPEQAARELYDYASAALKAKKGSQLGTKGRPSAVVQSAQRDMGQITADGIYGPSTRARGKQLTGVTFPERK